MALCLDTALPLDAETLGGMLHGQAAAVRIEGRLCENRALLSGFVREHQLSRLVIGACGRADEGLALERELRSAGLEPWDMETVRLDWWGAGAPARAALLLAAAVARLNAAVPVQPDNCAVSFSLPSGPVSRRALLGLARPRRRLVPSIDPQVCAALSGCRLCLAACPKGALVAEGHEIRIQRALCDGCGACVGGCPAGAVFLPGSTPEEMDAALRALLLAAPDLLPSRVVALACSEAFTRLGSALAHDGEGLPNLVPMAAPSLGMATPFLVLRSLGLGASGVILFCCSDGCRSHGGQGRLRRQVPALQRLLAGLSREGYVLGPIELAGERPDVPNEAAEFLKRAVRRAQRVSVPIGPEGSPGVYHVASALVGAARRFGVRPQTPVCGDDLGFASLQLDGEICSLCGLCAASCPSAALVFSESTGQQELRLTASRCVGCGLCEAACPESALRVESVVSVAELARPERTLRSTNETSCARCGRPHTGAAMVAAVARRLGSNNQRLLRLLRYCPECRMIA